MAYPAIPSRRIPYDIDGSAVGYTGLYPSSFSEISVLDQPPSLWLNPSQLVDFNDSSFNLSVAVGSNQARGIYFFFTELTEITHWALKTAQVGTYLGFIIQGSSNTTNGVDGTWETGIYSIQYSYMNHHLRDRVMTISFSGPVKAIRVGIKSLGANNSPNLSGFHFYGFKYVTETPDDILFVSADTGDNFVNLMDWGDRPEGTTQYKEFKMKNSSPDKIANNVNLQLNHSDFVMSFSPSGPWTSVLDIASLGAGASSATIYLKNELAPPPLPLGPETNARIIATVGSWT
jgi:hypothetical protein